MCFSRYFSENEAITLDPCRRLQCLFTKSRAYTRVLHTSVSSANGGRLSKQTISHVATLSRYKAFTVLTSHIQTESPRSRSFPETRGDVRWQQQQQIFDAKQRLLASPGIIVFISDVETTSPKANQPTKRSRLCQCLIGCIWKLLYLKQCVGFKIFVHGKLTLAC